MTNLDFLGGVSVGVAVAVVSNLILSGLRGNKKVSHETFQYFVCSINNSLENIERRLSRIESILLSGEKK